MADKLIGKYDDESSMQDPAPAPVRRQFERTPVKANAFVHRGSRFQRALIVDFSHGGLHLEGTFGLIKHDAIQIELMSGVRVFGKVAWSLGTHTGVIFAAPLPASHPAVLELAHRAAKALAMHSLSIAGALRPKE